MRQWPEFNEAGDLPAGRATLREVLEHFGRGNLRRIVLGQRLQRIYAAAQQTRCLARFVLFGSFVTAKPEPGDIDIFILMDDSFEVSRVSGETVILFDHMAAQNYFGASIFWLRRLAALEGEQAATEDWQHKRGGGRRGIIEIVQDDTK